MLSLRTFAGLGSLAAFMLRASCMDLDSLVGPEKDAASGDQGTLTTPFDAPANGEPPAVTDAGDSAPRTGTDTGMADAPDAGVRFCEGLVPVPAFCDDFDHGEPISVRWNTVLPDGGSLTVDPALFRSAPFALNAHKDFLPDAAGGGPSITRTLVRANYMKMGVDLFVEPFDPNLPVNCQIMAIGGAYRYRFYTSITRSWVEEFAAELPDSGLPATVAFTIPTLSQAQWHRIVLELNVPNKNLRLTVDGTVVLDRSVHTELFASTFVLNAGAIATSPRDGICQVRLDNISYESDAPVPNPPDGGAD